MALTRALQLSKGQRVNIYMDSKYAFLTLHAHASIWKDSLKQQQENLLTISERLRLLTAIYWPKVAAVMRCKGHSRDGSKAAEGNQLADCQARKAAL